MVLYEPSAKWADLRPAPSVHGGRAECDVAEVFAEVARSLIAECSVERVLGRICAVAVAFVPGCEHASITIVRGRRIETLVPTDNAPHQVDATGYETDEGPRLDAIRALEMFGIDDLSSKDLCSRFATRVASEAEFRGPLSLRLYAGEETYGALNLYPREPDAFTDESRALARALAAHGSVALAGAKEREETKNLERAVETRDVIGQAKGILMHKRGVTADQAFDMLVEATQHLNRRLRDVAERVARTGNDPSEIG